MSNAQMVTNAVAQGIRNEYVRRKVLRRLRLTRDGVVDHVSNPAEFPYRSAVHKDWFFIFFKDGKPLSVSVGKTTDVLFGGGVSWAKRCAEADELYVVDPKANPRPDLWRRSRRGDRVDPLTVNIHTRLEQFKLNKMHRYLPGTDGFTELLAKADAHIRRHVAAVTDPAVSVDRAQMAMQHVCRLTDAVVDLRRKADALTQLQEHYTAFNDSAIAVYTRRFFKQAERLLARIAEAEAE